MESMVNIISTVKNNISELEEQAKDIAKRLAAILQEKENNDRDMIVFKKVLADLTRTRDEEIQVVMAEKPVASFEKEKETAQVKPVRNYKGNRKPICAIDQNGERIAEYESRGEAAEDLKLDFATIKYRIEQVSIDEQIKKYGYALKKM